MSEESVELVIAGAKLSIAFARDAHGRMQAKEFMETVAPKADIGKLRHAFRVMADHGRIANEGVFRHEQGRIFAFKTGQCRLPCFRSGETWFLTHGFIKKKSKWPPTEFARAERIMAEHHARRGD